MNYYLCACRLCMRARVQCGGTVCVYIYVGLERKAERWVGGRGVDSFVRRGTSKITSESHTLHSCLIEYLSCFLLFSLDLFWYFILRKSLPCLHTHRLAWRRAWPHRAHHLPSVTYMCMSDSVSVTDTLSSRRLRLRCPVQRSTQGFFVNGGIMGRKVIPGLSMIKLTPHRVSQIRFCAVDTVAAAYSTLSHVQSHLSCWHHCIAITVSEWERGNPLEQHWVERIKAMLLLCLLPDCPSFCWSTISNSTLTPPTLYILYLVKERFKACVRILRIKQETRALNTQNKIIIIMTIGILITEAFFFYTLTYVLTWLPSAAYSSMSQCGPPVEKTNKKKLPEHLLSRSEPTETISVFPVVQRFGVHALRCIYYLYNSDGDSIYFPQMSLIFAHAQEFPVHVTLRWQHKENFRKIYFDFVFCDVMMWMKYFSDKLLSLKVGWVTQSTGEWKSHKEECCLRLILSATHERTLPVVI